MRKMLAALALALAASAVCPGQTDAEAARKEVDMGSRAYRAGRFAEAEQRFRRALELDPEGKNTRLYLARAIHQQYLPGVQYAENVAVGERAVAVYREALNKDPRNDDAYKAILMLYGQMKNEQKAQEFLLWRANDFSAPNERRAEAFVILAGRQWNCSYEITEQKENKTTEQLPDKVSVKYKMPADQGDFLKARQCAGDGLQLVEQALTLDPNSRGGWSYKGNLLREAAKLAEMEGDAAQKSEYERLYAEAFKTQNSLGAVTPPLAVEAGKGEVIKLESDVVMTKETRAGAPKKTVVNGTVLDGKAVSKPPPSYPDEARCAGARGAVTVRVLIDEEGRVIEATAVSGHPLLHDAAVSAARRARFSPTLLAGRPVKVAGHITYNFLR